MTKAPASITYASEVSRETVRIALMIATLKDLQVKSGNILNSRHLSQRRCEPLWVLSLAIMPEGLQLLLVPYMA